MEPILETEDLANLEKELVSYEGRDKAVHFTDFLLSKSSLQKRAKNFKSGFLELDKKMGGINLGEVIVISGHRKNGKTLFAESLLRSILNNDPSAKSFILSYEVQTEELLAKYVKESDLKLFVPMELKTMDFDWLYRRCLEAKLKHDCRLVLIDHLHFLVDMQTKQNMSLNIGAFMRRLKFDIALKLNMAVFLICHQSMAKDGQEASADRMRDSSFIGQECDSTILVSRRKNFTDKEFSEIGSKYGQEREDSLRLQLGFMEGDKEDNYSQGLATVQLAYSRRTGVYEYKKLFRKSGHFMEEI